MLVRQTQVTRRFLSTLTKFDLTLTSKGTRNPNFDPTVKTGWDQKIIKFTFQRLFMGQNWS